LAFALQIVFLGADRQVIAQAGKAAYPAMAPLDQYLMDITYWLLTYCRQYRNYARYEETCNYVVVSKVG